MVEVGKITCKWVIGYSSFVAMDSESIFFDWTDLVKPWVLPRNITKCKGCAQNYLWKSNGLSWKTNINIETNENKGLDMCHFPWLSETTRGSIPRKPINHTEIAVLGHKMCFSNQQTLKVNNSSGLANDKWGYDGYEPRKSRKLANRSRTVRAI